MKSSRIGDLIKNVDLAPLRIPSLFGLAGLNGSPFFFSVGIPVRGLDEVNSRQLFLPTTYTSGRM